MLSNNFMLSGSLPASLFLQRDTAALEEESSINIVLRAVVVEGTAVGGSLPAALCLVPQLQILALSGNNLTGSLPECIVVLPVPG